MTVASESASTGFFALDVPVRVFGPLRDVRVLPQPGGAGVVASARANTRSMPKPLREHSPPRGLLR